MSSNYYNELFKELDYLKRVSSGKTQVTKRTQKRREESLQKAFKLLAIEEFKYLDKATDKAKNKAIQKASTTLANKLEAEIYKPTQFARGVKVKAFQKPKLEKLEKEFNKVKEEHWKEFLKQNPKLSEKDKDYLMGKRVKYVNGEQELQLALSFKPEDFKKQVKKDTDINYFLIQKNQQMNDFTLKVGQYSNEKIKSQIGTWVDSGELTADQRDLLLAHFNNLDLVEKSSFNAQFEKMIAWIDSITKNPKFGMSHYDATMLVLSRQKDMMFRTSGYDDFM